MYISAVERPSDIYHPRQINNKLDRRNRGFNPLIAKDGLEYMRPRISGFCSVTYIMRDLVSLRDKVLLRNKVFLRNIIICIL